MARNSETSQVGSVNMRIIVLARLLLHERVDILEKEGIKRRPGRIRYEGRLIAARLAKRRHCLDNLRLERQNLVGRFDRDSLKPELAARYVIETFCGQLHLLEIRGCRKRLDHCNHRIQVLLGDVLLEKCDMRAVCLIEREIPPSSDRAGACSTHPPL